MSDPIVDRQVAVDFDALPTQAMLEQWVGAVLQTCPGDTRTELTVRFVEEAESRELNRDYRGRDRSTNVLAFAFEAPSGVDLPLLGDLIISAHVVAREAREQGKALSDHFAHMVVHGTLHLLGHDHIEDGEAVRMEQLERTILAGLGIDDPYTDVPRTAADTTEDPPPRTREDERPHA